MGVIRNQRSNTPHQTKFTPTRPFHRNFVSIWPIDLVGAMSGFHMEALVGSTWTLSVNMRLTHHFCADIIDGCYLSKFSQLLRRLSLSFNG